jgi:hypothetical protein
VTPNFKLALCIAVLVALIMLGVWMEIGLWSECRSEHSWFYCVRVLSQ